MSFSFVDHMGHGVFLHNSFITFVLMASHMLSCFCILFLNAAFVRWYVLPVCLFSSDSLFFMRMLMI